MTLWRNESQDTVVLNFDVGRGKRELITLAPNAEIAVPDHLDKYIPLEAPQLQKVEEVLAKDLNPQPKKRPGRKPKEINGIQ